MPELPPRCVNCNQPAAQHETKFNGRVYLFACADGQAEYEAPSSVHWTWNLNLHNLSSLLRERDADSNEVICAKAVLRTYCVLDGIADEMLIKEIELINGLFSAREAASEVLRERDLL